MSIVTPTSAPLVTWRVLIAIANHGRAAAVDLKLRMLATIATLERSNFTENDLGMESATSSALSRPD